MQIRDARYSDAETVLAWTNKPALWQVDSPMDYQPKTIETFHPQWTALVDRAQAWIIEVDQQPVGHLGWVPHSASTPSDQVTLHEFYIAIGENRALGCGYGCEAMHWLLDQARAGALDAVYGRVLGNNPHALGFFQRLGFQIVGRTPKFFERGGMHHDLFWVKHDLARNSAGLTAVDAVAAQPAHP